MSPDDRQPAHHFTDTDFSVEDVRLDGNSFTRCTFTRCRLKFSGEALPVFVECDVRDGTEFIFAGHALTTVQLLSMLVHRSGNGGLETFHRFLHDLYGRQFEPDRAG